MILTLAIALIATGMLSFDALGLGQLPGCGPDQGCAKATESVFGKIAFSESYAWPVSFLGFAFYIAMSAGLVAMKGRVNLAYKGVAVLGVLASAFYLVVMVLNWGDYFCQYCLASHLANFVFTGVVLTAPGRLRSAIAPATTVAVIAGTFVLATGGLAGVKGWADARTEQEIEQMGEDDTAKIIERSQQNDRSADNTATQTEEAASETLAADVEVGIDHPDLPLTAYRTDGKGFTGRYRLGPKDAKIRLVVYSDYGCKSCRIVCEEVKEILEARDDVSYSHKHYPFDSVCNPHISRTIHPKACEAGQIAEAVGAMHGAAAFWRFHFGFYDKLAREEPFTGVSLIDEMGLPGVETVRFAKNDPTMMQNVRDDVDEAYVQLGLSKTPTVFINGVEFRGWGVRGNLTRRVAEIASQIGPGTPEMDTPDSAFDKYVEDFFASGRRFPKLGDDARVNFFGNADAPVEMQVFFGYETERLGEFLYAFEDLRSAFPDTLRMTIRHYPWNERCNFFSERNRPNNSCVMHHALEAAGTLGGNEAFQKAYLWMLERLSVFDESMLGELASHVGVDEGALLRTVESQAVDDDCFQDATWLHTQAKRRAAKPVVFINGKRVERWEFNGDSRAVLEAIIRRELGLEQ
ncbi:MAG: hypothetical protein Tsb0013_00370 [Phycisphaerales bacterium]